MIATSTSSMSRSASSLLLGGLAMLVGAIRGAQRDRPKGAAMLIAGMMVTAFGLLIAGFAIAFAIGGAADRNADDSA